MGESLIYNTCLEDVDYFIERFERRAADPNGNRFNVPLDRLKQLKERLEHLRDGVKSDSSAAGRTNSGVLSRALDTRLTKLQASVEQRFNKLNLTVSSILENMTGIPRTLDIGLSSIDKAMQNLDAQVAKMQSDASSDRDSWAQGFAEIQTLKERLDGLSVGAPNEEVLGGVDDLTNDMNELRQCMDSLEERFVISQKEFLERSNRQSDLIEEVAKSSGNVSQVFKNLLGAVSTVQWPSHMGVISPAIPVLIRNSKVVEVEVEESLMQTVNLDPASNFMPKRPGTALFTPINEPMEFFAEEDVAAGETIQMSVMETAELVRSAREERPDPVETKDALDRKVVAEEFKFTLDDVDI
jgi:hypothetical protein